jgi:hypothetical protein
MFQVLVNEQNMISVSRYAKKYISKKSRFPDYVPSVDISDGGAGG